MIEAEDIGLVAMPEGWRDLLEDYVWERQTIGRSLAAVYRLSAPDRPGFFIKGEAANPFSELPGEATRLDWLADTGTPCPSVLGFETLAGRHWLLTGALDGHNLASQPEPEPGLIIKTVADALKRLHALPIADCPFDHNALERMAVAARRLDVRLVDADDFEDAHLGKDPAKLLARLYATLPAMPDPVVTHGDASLPNFMAAGDQFTGFLDCGRLGVADRYQDLALAGRSIAHNLGAQWIDPFYDAYGIEPLDRAKIDFYLLLDEFF